MLNENYQGLTEKQALAAFMATARHRGIWVTRLSLINHGRGRITVKQRP